MKKILYIIFYLLLGLSTQAQAVNTDHIIEDKAQRCKVHYLSSTPKKMWYIKTDNTCPNGWVEGFDNVHVFDLFDTPKEVLSCFFKNGYCLNQFISVDQEAQYGSLSPTIKTLSLLIETDAPSNTQYFALLRSNLEKDGSYSPFSLCYPDAYFLVAHPQAEDFKNTAFQGRLFKQIHQKVRSLCPKVQDVTILGATSSKLNGSDWIFKGSMNLKTGQADLRYRTPSLTTTENEPNELRKEKSETVLSVTSSENNSIRADYSPTANDAPRKEAIKNAQPWDYTSYNYSASDLALLAQIAPQAVQGQTIVYIKSVALDGTGIVDKPIPIRLVQAKDLKTGWAKIKGLFSIQDDQLVVKPLTVIPCSQEWCHEK